MYRLRHAVDRNDARYLASIDNMCFDNPLKFEHWEQFIRDGKVLLSTYWGTPVGYIVTSTNSIEVAIKRLAVKPQHQGQNLATTLIATIVGEHRDKYVTCTVPESMVFAENGRLGKFLNKLLFKAQLPILKEHFGEEDGICFVLETQMSRRRPPTTKSPR